ncbi:pyrrolo-quinoline quinone [Natrinema saccharevitans]|uniref:Pyrrolo-quinoline quinone n=1 Tax=Natrinema saccharevitans TaxID=301967 RepID=A0A1S8ATI4_9EURY|nr:PQQ-binding-like beta-propeller repeat protein [Natrinema saccharevitans]OLZ39887.1 pyrrolo-quinoline quinone [Natrinema saccharevitans]
MPSRRQAIASGVLGVAGLVGGYAAVDDRSDATTIDWPMARYDAAGTGHSPDAVGPKDDLQLAWEGQLEDTGGFAVTPPVVVDGTIYAGNEELVAFDAASGDDRFSYGIEHSSSPAYVSPSIYRSGTLTVGTDDGIAGLNADGGLRAFGVQLGANRWDGPGPSPSSPPVKALEGATPVPADGTVYVAIPDRSEVVALGATDGSERWRRRLDAGDGSGVTVRRPAVKDGTVFVTGWPSQVRALDAETGDVVWSDELDDGMVLPPTATADGVVVPTRGGLSVYEANGDVRWSRDLEGNATDGAVAVADGRVFFADGTESLHARDLETGAEEWTLSFTQEAAPIVADGVVYVTGGYDLVVLDAATGDRRFTRETDWFFSQPAVGDGVLYVVDGDSVLALGGTHD